jgi:putative ABC transport system substrate-binding protein
MTMARYSTAQGQISRRAALKAGLAAASLGGIGGCASNAIVWPWSEPVSRPLLGILGLSSTAESVEQSFNREGLAALGYREGQSIRVERRFAQDRSQLASFAFELVALQPDVLLASGLPALRALRDASSLFLTVGVLPDADVDGVIDEGFATSAVEPGLNVTGVVSGSVDVWVKRLEVLTLVAPIARAAIVWDVARHGAWAGYPRRPDIDRFAARYGLELIPVEAQDGTELEAAFWLAVDQGAQGVVIPPSPLAAASGPIIQALLQTHQLISVSGERSLVEIALISHLPNAAAMHRRAAQMVDGILRGSRPAQMPLVPAPSFDLIVNAAAARALGVTLPRALTSGGARPVR